jgi:hypothetical protein
MKMKSQFMIVVILLGILAMTACGGGTTPPVAPPEVQVDPCGNGICDEGENADSCPADCTVPVEPQPTPTEKIEPLGYVTFVVNVSDFVNLSDSAATLLHVIDLLDSFNLHAEFFLNGPMTHAYLQSHPEVIERLLETGMTISYHVLPPHPLVPGFQAPLEISAINLKEERIADYESQRLDVSTGALIENEPGGYQYLTQTFGVAPSAVSIPDDPIKGFALPHYATLGAKMVVLYNEPGADVEQPFLQEYGMWVRPVDINISHWPAEGIDASMAWWDMLATEFAASYQPALRLQTEAESWNAERLPFITIPIDEYNFYREGPAPWTMIYYRDPSMTQAIQPPFNLGAPDLSSPRSPENMQVVWTAYASMVEWAATYMQVVTSVDIVLMAELGE